MPTRKIHEGADDTWAKVAEARPCRDPGHNQPTMRVFQPGTYEHECPTCHRKMVFRVPCVSL
jgi:hypothetical protein